MSSLAAVEAVDHRYRAAGSVAIECHVLAWPTMRDAVRLLRELRRAADTGVSRSLEDILVVAGAWARIMSATPLAPADPAAATAELAEAVRSHDATALDSRLHSQLARLAGLLDAIGDETHPAAACLEEVISRYGRAAPSDPPAVYVAADADHAPLIEAWLNAKSSTPTSARSPTFVTPRSATPWCCSDRRPVTSCRRGAARRSRVGSAAGCSAPRRHRMCTSSPGRGISASTLTPSTCSRRRHPQRCASPAATRARPASRTLQTTSRCGWRR